MHEILRNAVDRLLLKQNLTDTESYETVGAIMDGQCDPVDIASFLTAMSCKGPVAAELVGAASAMRKRATPIFTKRTPLLDTCGTGGDQLHTFNISTATALLSAACGVAVAKHGNRSVSSSSGSADVLESLGVIITFGPEIAGKCLDEVGIAFCFAPLVHGAMKYAAPVRRQLGFPTIFNLLGPLTNPAGAEYQLLGASTKARARLLADALAGLGIRRAFVVCGNNELDEISLWGSTCVYEVESGSVTAREWTSETFGLDEIAVSQLQVSSPAESGRMIRAAFDGSRPDAASIVIANTAAALLVCGHAHSLTDGVTQARQAIQSGAATEKLNELIRWTAKA